MLTKPLVLVVDDELSILRAMRAYLPTRGYEVRTAPGGVEALNEIHKEEPNLILLDEVMPQLSGLEVCRRVREFSNVPIIFLSGKEAEADKVAALELGADDYVTKPYGFEELLARMRAILRRVQALPLPAVQFTAGDVVVDAQAHRVTIGGREVNLTPKEFEVLKHLISNAGKVVTHRALLQAVWGVEATEQLDYLRVFINQLRRKIEPDPSCPHYILTSPWVGYRFASLP
ncbi:MAG: response regulator transcription factor [Blastocatellia bacterium]